LECCFVGRFNNREGNRIEPEEGAGEKSLYSGSGKERMKNSVTRLPKRALSFLAPQYFPFYPPAYCCLEEVILFA
jgi:hypothetical protein